MARILIIDDDELFLNLLRQLLEHAGYEVVEALNGKVGIQLFRAERADLIITDIFMPDQDGLETIGALKREFLGVKIIAISSGGQGANSMFLKAAQGLGADRALAKPVERFERQALLAAIQELLGEGVSP